MSKPNAKFPQTAETGQTPEALTNRRLIFLIWVFLVGVIIIARAPFYAQTYLTVQLKGFEPNVFQVFYDRGQGFGEADSVTMDMPAPFTRGRVPLSYVKHLIQDYDFDFADLYFPLPPGVPLHGLRLDPGIRETTLEIRNICLENRYRRQCWQAAEIPQVFAPLNQISEMRATGGLLSLKITGGDPYLNYQPGNFAEVYRDFVQDDPRQRAGAYLLLLLGCVLAYWLAGRVAAGVREWRQAPGRIAAENVFLALGLVFGLALVFFNPPFQASDEAMHFARVLHLTQGKLVSEQAGGRVGLFVPRNALSAAAELASYYAPYDPSRDFDNEKFRYFLDAPRRSQDLQFVLADILYPPLSYLPQALGASVARLLDVSWLKSMYLGRIGNLLVWLGCVWLAIRVIPVGKWLLTLLALSPVPLYQAASLSVDSLTIALGFLLTALALRLALDQTSRPLPAIGLMLLLVVLIALTKQPYLFLVLLFLLVPLRHFGGLRKFLLLLGLGAGLGLAVVGLWLYSMAHVLTAFDATHNIAGHFAAILHNPAGYLQLLADTTVVQGGGLLASFLGRLGWFDVVSRYDLALPLWLIWLHGLMLLFYAATDAEQHLALTAGKKALLALVWLAGCLVIYTGLYFASTPLGSPVIWGLQGRYFIPMGLLPLLLLYNRRLKLSHTAHAWLTLAYAPMILGATLLVIAMHYFM